MELPEHYHTLFSKHPPSDILLSQTDDKSNGTLMKTGLPPNLRAISWPEPARSANQWNLLSAKQFQQTRTRSLPGKHIEDRFVPAKDHPESGCLASRTPSNSSRRGINLIHAPLNSADQDSGTQAVSHKETNRIPWHPLQSGWAGSLRSTWMNR